MPLAAAGQYPIWANVLIFLAAAVVVWIAGTRLVRYLDRLAERLGLEQALVGMLLLGGLTSLPEIANCVTSASIGNPALAVNNLLGSASINLLLLAIADACIGRDALTSLVAKPATLMQAALCMIVLALVAAAITTGDVAILGVGVWSLFLAAACVASFWVAARYGRDAPWTPSDAAQAEVAGASAPEGAHAEETTGRLVAKTAVAALAIFAAGYTLAQTGDALAEQTGLGSGIVGFLLIGFSTSLPELSSITAALRIRRYEMAIGEILGTNFANVALILLADAVFAEGPVINELGRFEATSALLGVTLTGMILVGLLERRDPTVLRMGYDSLAVVLLFAGGVALLFGIQ